MIDPILNPSRFLSGWLVARWLAALAFVAPLHAQLAGFAMTGATAWSYDPADGGAVITGIQHANVLAAWDSSASGRITLMRALR